MTKALNAPLSPREEITLRRVALGIAQPAELPPHALTRLRSLGLVHDENGKLGLTVIGRQRYEGLRRPDPRNPLLDLTRRDR